MKMIFDEVLGREEVVQEEITPENGVDHPHEDVPEEILVEEGDIDED